jgi:uncharacterized protein YjaZ
MTISVIDSAPMMLRILDAHPEERADLVREMWAPLAGIYHFVPGGVDMAAVHRQMFGFDWQNASSRLHEGVEALVRADAWSRIATGLDAAAARLKAANPGIVLPDLTVLLVLGDPSSDHFITEVEGLSAFGGISGYIAVTVWPTDQVLRRLEAIAAHELHHNVRYSPGGVVWNPATVTVGEHVIAEGLADTFATELYGEAGYTHFVSEETRADDQVLAKVTTGLDTTGMQDFVSWVLGDASARLLGGTPVGLPTGAGYAAGVRMTAAYLEATRGTAAQNVRTPAADILLHALPRLGLGPS